jgi:murein DD-endopeptidase MepM/ murein hydrolase activator NlpD
VRIAGLVTSSLYGAIEQLGEDRELAEDFSAIFAWDVDFSRGARRGDEFSILYERLYTRDAQGRETYVRPGQILAARYTSASDDFRAVYFESAEGHGGYYRPDGEPMERQFLKAPLDYKRISSSYTNSRFHPILKVRRPHHGIDYAAPYGTSVWSVGNGEVIWKGYQGGFGNLVKVRHVNGYVSLYAHLSRFAQGLRVGQRVHQKQVLGFVGSTGLSTGPHLCFRLVKEGEYVNPALMHEPGGEPIPKQARRRFQAQSDELLAALDPRPLVVTNEAL